MAEQHALAMKPDFAVFNIKADFIQQILRPVGGFFLCVHIPSSMWLFLYSGGAKSKAQTGCFADIGIVESAVSIFTLEIIFM